MGLDPTTFGSAEVVHFGERLDAATVEKHQDLIQLLKTNENNLFLDISKVDFVDSTGLGLLLRLQKQLRAENRQLVLIGPTPTVRRAFELMRISGMFSFVEDLASARDLVRSREGERTVGVDIDLSGRAGPLVWAGEVVAANVESVWNMTQYYLEMRAADNSEVIIRLGAVRFIDSTGVRLMVKVRKHGVKMGLTVRFADPSPPVLNVLRIVRLDSLLLG